MPASCLRVSDVLGWTLVLFFESTSTVAEPLLPVAASQDAQEKAQGRRRCFQPQWATRPVSHSNAVQLRAEL